MRANVSRDIRKAHAALLGITQKALSKATGQLGRYKVSLSDKIAGRTELKNFSLKFKNPTRSPAASCDSRRSGLSEVARQIRRVVPDAPKKQSDAWSPAQPQVAVRLSNETAKGYHNALRHTLVTHLGCSEDEARALCNQAALIHEHSQGFEKLKQNVDASLVQENPLWATHKTAESEARRAEILGPYEKKINDLKAEFFGALQSKADAAYLAVTDESQSGIVERVYNNAQSGDIFDFSGTRSDLLQGYLSKADDMTFLGAQLRQAAQDELNRRALDGSK